MMTSNRSLKKPLTWFDRLTTSGYLPIVSTLPPFALSVSEGERSILKRPTRTLILGALAVISITVILFGCEMHSRAKQIMQQQKCLECHTINGKGGAVGPNLSNVGSRRSRDYIIQQLKDPKSHNPDTQMPSFKDLPEQDLKDVADYLASLK